MQKKVLRDTERSEGMKEEADNDERDQEGGGGELQKKKNQKELEET